MAANDSRRRVKFYVLNDMRQWDDRGTGYVSWSYSDKQRCVSIVVKSEIDGSTLLDSKILVSIVYQKQQDTLIVWSDMDKRDMALSFQEKSGCDEIWEKICEVHGKDTSTRITSSRSGDGNGGSGSGMSNDNLDESDEDQLDSDGNTSPSTDLPACELNKLKEIRDFFVNDLMRKSNPYKEKLTSILETENYIKRLIDLFHMCEDLENTEGLNHLFEIFRSLFYLNKSPLLDILLCDDLIMEVIGCLEYDPSKSDPIKHREYIATKAQFKEVIPFDNIDLVNKIHQTYRVQYIQDVILPAPSVFEENSLAALNSFIFLNKVEIANLIQEDERFLNELFESLKKTDFQSEDVQKRRDMFQFLKEYISFLHGLQQAREPLYQSLYNHGILNVVEVALNTKDEKINTIAIEIFSQFVEVVPTLVREFILKEVDSRMPRPSASKHQQPATPISSFSFNSASSTAVTSAGTPQPPNALSKIEPISSKPVVLSSLPTSSLSAILNLDDESFEPVLINFVIRQMINDPDQELSGALQIINLLKLLIDPENMLSSKYVASKVEKSEFLAYFYKKSMCVLLAPLMANTAGGKIMREDYRIAQLENLILDFLSFCVERHTYHIKNYIIHKDLLKRILVLLKSKHQFLALSALRFLRKTLSLKEETYNKYIIKANLFAPVVEALKTNGARYNILNSAIIELFDFIRSDDIKSLMTYVIEGFYPELENLNYVRTFKDLKLRYDQHKEKQLEQANRSRLSSDSSNSCSTTPSLYRTRDRYRTTASDRIDYDKDDDAYFQEDENELDTKLEASPSSSSSNTTGFIFSSSSSSSSSSSTSSSSSNQFNSLMMHNHSDDNSSETTNIESYLEFKKQSTLAEDSEDTIFSSSSSSTSTISSSTSGAAHKTINIKITTSTVQAIKNSSSKSLSSPPSNGSSPNSSQENSNLSSSPYSTPTNSPLAKKHALVAYEYDSDEDEEEKSQEAASSSANKENSENNNEEPLAKRIATETDLMSSEQDKENAVNVNESSTTTNEISNKTTNDETTNNNKQEDDTNTNDTLTSSNNNNNNDINNKEDTNEQITDKLNENSPPASTKPTELVTNNNISNNTNNDEKLAQQQTNEQRLHHHTHHHHLNHNNINHKSHKNNNHHNKNHTTTTSEEEDEEEDEEDEDETEEDQLSERPMNISPTLTGTNANSTTTTTTTTNNLILNTASNLKTTCAISSTKTPDETMSESCQDADQDDSSATSPLGPANKRQRLVE